MQVDVWLAELKQDAKMVGALWETLSPDEQARADRYRVERARTQFVVSRGVLRSLLAPLLGRNPAEVRFGFGEQGKPHVSAGAGIAPPIFNVAHSGDLALVAVAAESGPNDAIGVDLERVRALPGADSIVRQFATHREQAAFARLPESERQDAFFRWWTRKEAMVKAIGVGWSGVRGVEVPIDPEQEFTVRTDSGTRWHLFSWTPEAGYAAALAAPATSAVRLVHRLWEPGRAPHAD